MKNIYNMLPRNIANMIRNMLVQIFVHSPFASCQAPCDSSKSKPFMTSARNASLIQAKGRQELSPKCITFRCCRGSPQSAKCFWAWSFCLWMSSVSPIFAGSSERSNVGRSTPTCTSSSRFAASLLQCLRAHDVKIHGHEYKDNIYM